jgi:hypothetical protein
VALAVDGAPKSRIGSNQSCAHTRELPAKIDHVELPAQRVKAALVQRKTCAHGARQCMRKLRTLTPAVRDASGVRRE